MPDSVYLTDKTPSTIAFDHLAPHYDAHATDIAISRWLRARVWQRLAVLFQPGDHILEIGCGTGEDAIWLAQRSIRVTASDGSAAMLSEAQRKAEQVGVSSLIEFVQLDLVDTQHWNLPEQSFDGAFSNFGALNCIGDWRDLASKLAYTVRPGGRLAFGVMPPFCAWESLWHLLRLRPGHAMRRWNGLSQASIGGLTFSVYYPTARRLLQDFGIQFRQTHLMGLGVFLPPSDLYQAVSRHPHLTSILMFLERNAASLPLVNTVGDHFWLELERLAE